MKDRISTQVLANGAIRYAEYDSGGTFQGYHYMLAADEPIVDGTPLNKATFLKTVTEQLFGLENNSTVDDAFAWLAKFNTHAWKRTALSWREVQTVIGSNVTILSNNTVTLSYSNNISISGSGVITLVSPSTMTITSSIQAPDIASLAPCYISFGGNVYFLPNGTVAGTVSTWSIFQDNYSNSISLSASASMSPKAKVVTAANDGAIDAVFSTNRSEYPDDGTVGNYHYNYYGVPFEKFPFSPQIATGSYVGTGTYGQSNPCTINLGFMPKLVFVYKSDMKIVTSSGYGDYEEHNSNVMIACYGATSSCRRGELGGGYSGMIYNYYTFNSTGFSWYSAYDTPSYQSGTMQLNQSTVEYHYIAIG